MNDFKDKQRAVELAEQINALPEDCTDDDVVALFRVGDINAFWFMDEKPASYECGHIERDGRPANAYGWCHMRLRQVRNGRSGHALFDRMKGDQI